MGKIGLKSPIRSWRGEVLAESTETRGTTGRGSLPLCLILAGAIVMVGAAPSAAHDKTDVVVLQNGDRISCEIKSLSQGVLKIGIDAAGTVNIKWPHVVNLTSSFDYQVEDTSGERYFGSFAAPDKPGSLKIVTADGTHSIPLEEVFGLLPIEQTFWRKLNGSINFGFSYTQSNRAIQYSLSANSNYRTRKLLGRLQLNSIFNTQEGADSANQQSLGFRLTRAVKKKSGVFGLAELQSNPDQGFDVRSIVGGGYDRFLAIQRNGYFAVAAGLVYDREQVAGSSRVDNSAEALIGLELANYSDDHPKRTITLGFNTFTNVTDAPRFRAQLNFNLSWELIHNFNVGFNVIDNYDSRPPTIEAAKNDLSVVMSVGYTYW